MVKPDTKSDFIDEFNRVKEETNSGDVIIANEARRKMVFLSVIAEMVGVDDGDNNDETVAPESLTKAELVAALTNMGIAPKSGATKAELLALYNIHA